LLVALLEPGKLQPVGGDAAAARPDRGPVNRRGSAEPLTAEWLQQQALEVAEQKGSTGLRIKLARSLARPTTPRTWRERLGGFLLDEDPRNLAAQFILYQAADLQAERREAIEAFFTHCGSLALAEMLRLPADDPSQRGRRGGEPTLTPAAAVRCAGQIWGDRATSVFLARLEDVVTLGEHPGLVRLCATMPVKRVRSALRDVLRRHDNEGPGPLSGSRGQRGSAPSVLDPALLLAVKSLPRPEQDGRDTRGRGGRDTDSWMQFSEDLVLDWCERLHQAALHQAEATRLAGRRPQDAWRLERLPFELHDGAAVRAAHFVAWPEMLPEGLDRDRVAPTTVQYVRIEQRETMRRMQGYYGLKTRQRDPREIGDGVWLDAYLAGATPETRMSVDVLIRGEGQTRGRSRSKDDEDDNAERNLTIELLIIEAANPEW
jgi:hypothetical protein